MVGAQPTHKEQISHSLGRRNSFRKYAQDSDDGRSLAERLAALWSHVVLARPRNEEQRAAALAARAEGDAADARMDKWLAKTRPAMRSTKLQTPAAPDLARLLTLRVDFRDEKAAAEITPEQAIAYLRAHGWTLDYGSPTVSIWTHPRAADVKVPGVIGEDYGRRLLEVLREVAEAEARSPLAVWCEMRS